MADIFDMVLKTSIYASIVGLVILLSKAFLKNKLDARWHYLIWMILLVKLLMPFGPESAYSLFNAVDIPPAISGELQYAIPYPAKENTAVISPVEGSHLDTVANSTSPVEAAARLAPYIWGIGAATMLLWLAASYMLLNRKLRHGAYLPSDRVMGILESCKLKLGIKKNIKIIVQQSVGMPSLFGAAVPRILLTPEAALLSEKELEYILLHELAHYKRRDIYINYLLLLLQVVHWFNPIMWHCFKVIRQDMEAATDQYVLSQLEQREYIDYGRALLTIMENFSSPKLAPKLLAMADDRKGIERRLKMIKMSGFFKRRRNIILVAGILCIVLLGGVLLTSGVTKDKDTISQDVSQKAAQLIKFKTPYVGDNSKVRNLVGHLEYGDFVDKISLQTNAAPYGLTVDYNFGSTVPDKQQLIENSAMLFSLIGNLDVIQYNISTNGQDEVQTYTREQLQASYGIDLKEYSKDLDSLSSFIESFRLKIFVSPEKYSLAMSSTPGMKLQSQYRGEAAKVLYSADKGLLFSWEALIESGLSNLYPSIELPYGTAVYWAPHGQDGKTIVTEDSIITIKVLDAKGKILAQRQLFIDSKEGLYFYARPDAGVVIGSFEQILEQEPQSLDSAVSDAVKARESAYRKGEVATEGHVILAAEEKDGILKVYAVASFGSFEFENGVFTKISGSGAIPTVITFSRKEAGQLQLLEYKEPLDGGLFGESLKEMFPASLLKEVQSLGKYGETLEKQQEAQAAAYLKSMGRTAAVSIHSLDKKLADIDVEASNKLFAGSAKYDPFINSCPYWLGSREQIENGQRFIYETMQSKSDDGYDLITFRKTKQDGSVVQEKKYKIIGSEPTLAE